MTQKLVWTCPEPREGQRGELINQGQGPLQGVVKRLDSSDVSNVSDVPGATVTDALNELDGDVQNLDSSDIANVSEVPGATVTDALDALYAGQDDGYITRLAYVNAASARIGTAFRGATCQAIIAGWLTEADVPPGREFTFETYAAGGGGVGGLAYVGGSSFTPYGAPGAGGAYEKATYFRRDILDSLPILFAAGLGGVGSNGGTVNVVGTGTGDGLAGTPTDGGDCSAGALCQAFGGKAGVPRASSSGTSQAGVGGGILGKGSGSNGGSPGAFTAGGNPGAGGGGVNSSSGTAAASTYLGGAAGSSPGTPGSPQQKGGTSRWGGCGGGPGAGHNTASTPSSNGGDGGGPNGGFGGQSLTSSANNGSLTGGDGGDGDDAKPGQGGQGGAGGGAAKMTAPGVGLIGTRTARGGRGGRGGFPGGGGGGGGGGACSTGNDASSNQTAHGGVGADGEDACLLITIR
jgi:hypothetical protein